MEKKYRYIDLTYLKSASKDDVFFKKILTVFHTEYTELLEELRLFFGADKTEDLLESLHKAKSSVLLTTIPKGRELVIDLESKVKTNAPKDAQKQILDEFVTHCDLAMQEIRDAENSI